MYRVCGFGVNLKILKVLGDAVMRSHILLGIEGSYR